MTAALVVGMKTPQLKPRPVDLLKQRVITAVILVAVLIASLLGLPPEGMAMVFTFAVLVASWEWAKLAGITAVVARLAYSVVCAGLMAAIIWYCQLFTPHVQLERLQDILGLGCLWWALALLWVKGYPGSAALWGSVFIRCLMGLVVLLPAWLGLIFLRDHQHGIAYILILLALVACADIGAYFTGRAWGKAKLAVNVSPGKSWAGFWGGLAASNVFAVVLWSLWGQGTMSLGAVVAVALVTALASVLGDLVESMVKRHQGVKDSGTILPGHGGVMDRIDSITAASPVFALSLLLVGW